MKIYLDTCSLCRPYDHKVNTEIVEEAIAVVEIMMMVEKNWLELCWSDILDYEVNANPNKKVSKEILRWGKNSKDWIHYNKWVIALQEELLKMNFKIQDSLHLSSAIMGRCRYFITTDKGILNKSSKVDDLVILNPVEFITLWR